MKVKLKKYAVAARTFASGGFSALGNRGELERTMVRQRSTDAARVATRTRDVEVTLVEFIDM